jgi:hypothetical protein
MLKMLEMSTEHQWKRLPLKLKAVEGGTGCSSQESHFRHQ